MQCPYCGTQLPEDAVFCASCGNRLPTGQSTPYQTNDSYTDNDAYASTEYHSYNSGYEQPYQDTNDYAPDNGYYEQPQTPANSSPNKKSNVLIGVICGMGAVILILLVVLIALLVSDRSGDDISPVETQSEQESESETATLPLGTTQATLPDTSNTAPSATVPTASVPNTSTVISTLTPGSYRVNTRQDDLNIRSGAGETYSIVGRIPKDTVVTVTAVNGDWAYVTYNNVSGWVSAQYLAPVIS